MAVKEHGIKKCFLPCIDDDEDSERWRRFRGGKGGGDGSRGGNNGGSPAEPCRLRTLGGKGGAGPLFAGRDAGCGGSGAILITELAVDTAPGDWLPPLTPVNKLCLILKGKGTDINCNE